ncbi:MAG: glycosyltransferase family 2 protein [Pseudomonadota bacterium]
MSVRLTAILTCRNGAATLARCLDHLAWHGAETIVIDNGSTDDSREIAVQRLGQGVIRVIDDPYQGAFDLTQQLRQKADLIAAVGSGWVIHADVDEFLDAPDGQPLSTYLRYWETSDIAVFACREALYLPESETSQHSPEDFTETMKGHVLMVERDQKQRLFRATCDLSRWMASGGHTVARHGTELSPVDLPLRHYFGLSLDHIRARTLGRIFAPRDLAKNWHATRLAQQACVIAPPEGLLQEGGAVKSVESIPVLSFDDIPTPRDRSPVDLAILSFAARHAKAIAAQVTAALPGLRVVPIQPREAIAAPVICLYTHPNIGLTKGADEVAHAEAWLRYVASARQDGLEARQGRWELRLEDCAELGREAAIVARALLSGHHPAQLLPASPPPPPVSHQGYGGRLKEITGSLARDLGYV